MNSLNASLATQQLKPTTNNNNAKSPQTTNSSNQTSNSSTTAKAPSSQQLKPQSTLNSQSSTTQPAYLNQGLVINGISIGSGTKATSTKPPVTSGATSPTANSNSVVKPIVQPTQPKYDFGDLPFDPTKISVGDAYARIMKLDNDENAVTHNEQFKATKLLNSGLYKEIPIYEGSNIYFQTNETNPTPQEAMALRELQIMASMKTFQGLFNDLKASRERVLVMVSKYGPGYAASNVTLYNQQAQKTNVITLDPDFVDYKHNDPTKRNVFSALSNELAEIASRVKERSENVNFVATRPFQEATLAIDELMENYIQDYSRNNKVSFADLTAAQRDVVMSGMQYWSSNTGIANLQKKLNDVNQSQSYSRFANIADSYAASIAANELNKKLNYLFGVNRQFTIKPSLMQGGGYNFSVSKI